MDRPSNLQRRFADIHLAMEDSDQRSPQPSAETEVQSHGIARIFDGNTQEKDRRGSLFQRKRTTEGTAQGHTEAAGKTEDRFQHEILRRIEI